MEKQLPKPSQIKNSVELDVATYDFLVKNLETGDFSATIKTDEEYSKIAFYLKAVGFRLSLNAAQKDDAKTSKFSYLFACKENTDIFYDCLKNDASQIESLIEAGDFSSLKFNAVSAAFNAIKNDVLYDNFGAKDENGACDDALSNLAVTKCLVYTNDETAGLNPYLKMFEKYHPEESARMRINYQKNRTQKREFKIPQNTTNRSKHENPLLLHKKTHFYE